MSNSVFKGRNQIIVSKENHPSVINQLYININKVPGKVANELSQIHLQTSKAIIEDANVSDNAQKALISRLQIQDKNTESIKVVSLSNVSNFFEQGVEPHEVYNFYTKESGKSVQSWLDDKGLNISSFIVGGPGSTLQKPGLQFMNAGFIEAVQQSDMVVDKYLNLI